jgi:RNA polymerase sigma-32 factor
VLFRSSSGATLTDAGRQTIAAELRVDLTEVQQMDLRLGGGDQSLNAPVGIDGRGDWQDLLPDSRPNPEQVTVVMRDDERRSRWLAEAMGELSARERAIIRERRLTEDGTTLQQLGLELGISKERVRQLEHRAMRKLREAIGRRASNAEDLFNTVY